MADYYWVGSAGNWNSTNSTNWASSSGGSGGAGIPAATDNVHFDVNSGTGNIAIGSGATCLAFIYSNTASIGFTSTGNFVAAYGDFTVSAGSSSALQGLRISFNATATITSPVTTKIGYVTFVTGTATGVASIGRAVFASSAIWALGGGNAYADALYSSSGGTPGVTNGIIYITPGGSFTAIDVQGFTFNGTTIVIQNSANACSIGYSCSSTNAPSLTVNTTQTVDFTTVVAVKNLTFNSGIWNYSSSYVYVYGDIYLDSSSTINSSYVDIRVQKIVGSPTATRNIEIHSTLNASYASGYGITISAGADTVQLTGTNFCSNTYPWGYVSASTPLTITASNLYLQYLLASGTVNLTGATTIYATVFNPGSSVTTGSCAIHLKEYYSYGQCQFYGAGLTYASLTIDSNVPNKIYDNNTFGNLTCSTALGGGAGKSLKFDDGSTQTVTGTFTLTGGSPSDTVTLTTIGGTSAATISKASGTVNASYSTISYSTATGGATFKAPLLTNTDGGNNSGWVFSGGATGNFFAFF